jgi:hypothetical protein
MTWYPKVATGWRTKVQLLAGAMLGSASLWYHIQIGSVAHPASYPMGTVGSYPSQGMKLTTHLHLVPRLRHGAIQPLLNTSSWHSAQLSKGYFFMIWCLVKHKYNFTFTFNILLNLVFKSTISNTKTLCVFHYTMTKNSSVSKLAKYWLGFNLQHDHCKFSLYHHIPNSSGDHPGSYPLSTWALSLRAMQMEYKTDLQLVLRSKYVHFTSLHPIWCGI